MIQKGEGVILSSTEFRALLEKVNGQLCISLPLYIKNNLDEEEDDWELRVLHIEGMTSSDGDFSDYIKDETVDFSPVFSFGSYPELQRSVGRNLNSSLLTRE
ncbi:hypothetical protein [Paenibacillus xylanilyticus]|uniref:hypothetical protein n=1 Tax=Paenibacillus xylanilyticus TaxID=248903 RepID=UPI00399F62C8